jgi:hypothetical protein
VDLVEKKIISNVNLLHHHLTVIVNVERKEIIAIAMTLGEKFCFK